MSLSDSVIHMRFKWQQFCKGKHLVHKQTELCDEQCLLINLPQSSPQGVLQHCENRMDANGIMIWNKIDEFQWLWPQQYLFNGRWFPEYKIAGNPTTFNEAHSQNLLRDVAQRCHLKVKNTVLVWLYRQNNSKGQHNAKKAPSNQQYQDVKSGRDIDVNAPGRLWR